MKAQILDQKTFDDVLQSSTRPVLVDFWAEWCGPCKMLAPVIDELAQEHAQNAVIAKVNIDDAPELAARYGITAIPSLLVFRDGKVVQTLQGLHPKATLSAALKSAA